MVQVPLADWSGFSECEDRTTIWNENDIATMAIQCQVRSIFFFFVPSSSKPVISWGPTKPNLVQVVAENCPLGSRDQ